MTKCQICGSTKFALVATEIREGEGRITKCGGCGLVVQDIDWSKEKIESYYNEEYQITNSLESGREQTSEERFNDRLKTIDGLVNQVSPLLRPDMSVLEVGCGAGELLYSIKPHVKEVTGVEMFKGFVDYMNGKLGIKAYAGDVNEIEFNKKFDLIISIDTLDHLKNPLQTLETFNRLVKPSGSIYLQVPNLDEALNVYLPAPEKEAYNRFFWHRAHFFYFTEGTLAAMMKKAGFTPERIWTSHQYTMRNYLNWHFKGVPQDNFVDAATGVGLFSGNSKFEKGMNEIFANAETKFQQLLAETMRGDTLCCIGKPVPE